jgi:amino acid adenylation domain-containing protein
MKPAVVLLLEKSFNENKHRQALWLKGKYYTYEQLSQKINAILPKLNNRSRKGKPIAIITHDEPETYASIISALLTGNGFVPISPSFPIERARKIIQLSGAELVFSCSKPDKELYTSPGVEVYGTLNPKPEVGTIKTCETTDYNSVACILFTSGSTGEPKGVPMTYKNIDTTIDSYFSLGYGLNSESLCLQMFEFTFDMSLISYLPAFISGSCVYSMVDDKMRFFSAFKIMKKFSLTFAVFVPSTLAFMRKYFPAISIPSLQCCMVGGEPFSLDLAMEWAQCAPNTRIINISGPTETTMACMGYEVKRTKNENKTLNGILAFGKPWKNTKAVVVNENLEVLRAGERGELCFSGENVMKGYINNQEKNKEVFFTKQIGEQKYTFYRTGDGAYYDAEGDFYTCGRIDLQVKIQGYRVEPGEIEAAARTVTGDILLAAIPYKKHDGFNAIRLFIENGEELRQNILNYLTEKLPAYMIPDDITSMRPMPLNQNGKIDRNYLKQLLESDKQ